MRRQELSEYDKKSIRDAEDYLDHQYFMEEDPFFEEVAEMLDKIDNKKKNNYFDEILSEIPSEEIPEADNDFETLEEVEKRMDALIAEQEELDAKLAEQHRKEAQERKHLKYLKSVEMEVMSQNYINRTMLHSFSAKFQGQRDEMRINKLLTHIRGQVRLLGVWSPAKNMYQKILRNNQLSNYAKVQQLIATARRIHEKNTEKEKGFILKRLTFKSAKIHEEIASLDINSDNIIKGKFKLHF